MIFEKMENKKILEGIFGNYRINYLTKFDLFKDIVLIAYMFCAKILFLKFYLLLLLLFKGVSSWRNG